MHHGGAHGSAAMSAAPARLLDGMGNLHHPVTTSNPEAQKFFDQGLTLVYAFNHDEAIRSFQRAAELDPNLAMAHWGIALALGPNYNVDVDPPREKRAYEEIQKARALGKSASEPERDYIEALATRYSNAESPDLKQLARDYHAAMQRLSDKYPDDLDAATLLADAGMNLRPWRLWTKDGKPEEGTEQIVEVLELVLKRDPDHIGANHLYIHAVEASLHPERALESAGRLPGLAPGCGHLVHMPSHIYVRTGDLEAAAGSNEQAIAADRAYLALTNASGIYPMMYYSHNMHFLAYADAQQGRFEAAGKSAKELADHVGPHVAGMQMLEGFMTFPALILVRFGKWDQVLAMPEPDAKTMPVTNLVWHWSRGVALAAKGSVQAAQKERETFDAASKAMPPDAMYGNMNKAADVLAVARDMLDARIALARGNRDEAVRLLTSAAANEDRLVYQEPPDWIIPSHEMLGFLLLSAGDYTGAEQAFRQDLQHNARSGRSLFGLCKALQAQKKTYAADFIRRQFETAWKNADTKPSLD
jgi:tetratricopeptide (TPR) repeat protein